MVLLVVVVNVTPGAQASLIHSLHFAVREYACRAGNRREITRITVG